MIDIILTRTQRKTPTVIHPGYKISRIRDFYMRKVKFTQQTIDEKLGTILDEYPRLDNVHPFFADLINILYDRDHFKLALGQVNTAKNLVSGICKDYLRMMKYGDSLYRCKQLKRAALGRMCSLIMKLKASLGYLEEVRKHISRLPSLDPNTRTLLLTGYPNVGKSSFMNKVTRAEVDVQSYAFTTKALYVGHTDHRYLRWQVVDTPGILDRPLEERNTIEMQAITALAHLQCCILYFLDISEQCGYTVDAQLALFNSIRPLFANKEVVMVANKIDVVSFDSLDLDTRLNIEQCAQNANAELLTMSNKSEENIASVKIRACDKLLEARVDEKVLSGKVSNDVLSRITTVIPKVREGFQNSPQIPDTVINAQTNMNGDGKLKSNSNKPLEKQLMWEQGGPGVYSCNYSKYYLLKEEDWKSDIIPEIMDGKNVMDFFTSDIEKRLDMLDEEEIVSQENDSSLDKYGVGEEEGEEEGALHEDELILYESINEKKEIAKMKSRLKSNPQPRSQLMRGRNPQVLRNELNEIGHNADVILTSTTGRKRTHMQSQIKDEFGNTSVEDERDHPKRRLRSQGRAKSTSRSSRTMGSVAPHQKQQVIKDNKVLERNEFKYAKRGPGDREHYPKLVKHMNSGKRGLGTKTIGR
jgi:nucleolar GTP-binding protein